MSYKTFKEGFPPKQGWIKVLYNAVEENGTIYGASGWEFFVEANDNMALFSDNEKMDYIFPAGEEGITHWFDKKI